MMTLSDDINAVKREIARRRRTYTESTKNRVLSREAADLEIAAFESVLARLELLTEQTAQNWGQVMASDTPVRPAFGIVGGEAPEPKVGATCRLVSGSPPLTIEAVLTGTTSVLVSWIGEDGTVQRDSFPVACIKVVER